MSIFKRLFGGSKKAGGNGEPSEFKAFLDESMKGLQLQTSAHQGAWHFGEEERWDFSQDTGELIFTFPDTIVRASAQVVGSFDSAVGSWMWAWANTSVDEKLTRHSAVVRQYGQKHSIPRLTEPKWSGDEMDAWTMVALACRLCRANGAYRGPTGDTFVFFSFGKVQISKR